jgi:hypothetical protein
MRPVRTNVRVAARVAALALLLAVVPIAAAAPTDAAVRACVEGNLVRYGNPDTAVTAQYSDLETRCIAALDGVSVEIDPAPSGGGDGGGGAAGGGGGGDPTQESEGSSGAGGGQTPPGAGATADRGEGPRAAPPASVVGSAEVVRAAIVDSETDSGPPFATSVAGMPGWLLLLIGCLAAGLAAAAALEIRRRHR